MEDRFCPSCGAARDPAHTFCPKCGRNFAPKAKPDALHHPVIGRLIVLGLLFGLIGIIAVLSAVHGESFASSSMAAVPPPTVTPIPAPTCDAAEQAVAQRHATMFRLMQSQVTGFQLVCGDAQNGVRVVGVVWTWNGAAHQGNYAVDLRGNVTAADATAQKLDEAAKAGPLALKLLGGL